MLLFISSTMLFGYFSIDLINNFNNEYRKEDLTYKELTFERYKISDGSYYIYVKEYNKPIYIPSIIKEVNIDYLDILKQGDILDTYLYLDESTTHSAKAIDINKDKNSILTLEDYNHYDHLNKKIGLIVAPILTLLSLTMTIIFSVYYFKKN